MVRKVLLLGLFVGLLLLPSVASADALVFGFTGGRAIVTTGIGTGFISNDPTNPPSPTVPAASTLSSIGTFNLGTVFSGNLGTFVFTTGNTTSVTTGTVPGVGSGKIVQATYGPGGSITVKSGSGLGALPNATLFTGFFSGTTTFAPNSPPINATNYFGPWTLTGRVTTTTLNPALLALLGLPPLGGGSFQAIVLDVSFRLNGAIIQSGSMTLVPEPGTLALFGTGLIGLAGLIRRRMK